MKETKRKKSKKGKERLMEVGDDDDLINIIDDDEDFEKSMEELVPILNEKTSKVMLIYLGCLLCSKKAKR